MQSKQNIRIVPIFDQSVGGVWADFTRIEAACDLKYGYNIGKKTRNYVYNRNMKEWEKEKYTFAFGAYVGEKMVGFASGYRENKQEMYLHNLYVLPEYEGKGIGKSLLGQSERNASLITDKMTLISLSGALSFYENRKYNILDECNCEKKLSKEFVGVVPVFKSIDWLRNVKINLDIDTTKLEHDENLPMFAYVSLGREIDGLALRTSTGEDKIWTNPKKLAMKDFYEKKLQSALSKVR